MQQFRDKYVLVDSNTNSVELAHSYGFRKAISVQEIIALYPDIVPSLDKQDAKVK